MGARKDLRVVKKSRQGTELPRKGQKCRVRISCIRVAEGLLKLEFKRI